MVGLLISAIILIVFAITNLLLGPAQMELGELFKSDIFWQLRVPRTLNAVIAGTTLALSGHVTQILFRNSLATPYTLGVASAAGLGAIIAMTLGLSWAFVSLSSLIFSGLVVLILIFGFFKKNINSYSLLLLGISLNLFCGAMISIIQVTAGKLELASYLGWVMGSVSVVGFDAVYVMALPSVVLIYFSLKYSRALSILAIEGDSYTRGFNPKTVRFTLLGIITVAVALLVSKLGPIGFIGLVIPHLSRGCFKSEQHYQLIGSMILGASFLVLADVINRTLVGDMGLPVGVITTFVGAPALAFIIWKKD